MGFTTAEVAKKSGATYRQLDYWARMKWIDLGPDLGTGVPREWAFRDMVTARLVSTLVGAGFDVARAFGFADHVMAEHATQEMIRFELAEGVQLEIDIAKATRP